MEQMKEDIKQLREEIAELRESVEKLESLVIVPRKKEHETILEESYVYGAARRFAIGFIDQYLEVQSHIIVAGRSRTPVIFKRTLYMMYLCWCQEQGLKEILSRKQLMELVLEYFNEEVLKPEVIKTSNETMSCLLTGKNVGGMAIKNIWWKDPILAVCSDTYTALCSCYQDPQ